MSPSVDDSRLAASAEREDRGARLEAAARWLETELAGQPAPPLLVVIGLGDGDLLDVLDQRAPATKVLALEPDVAIATRFLQRPDLPGRRAAGRLAYLADPEYTGADEAWRVFPTWPDEHRMIVSPAVAREGGPGAIRAARIFKQILFGVRANAEARKRFAPGYLTGSLHNLPELVAGQDIRALTGAYRGTPAVIAAAGPSLDGVLGDLEAVRDRAVLIAADTALRPLLNHGLAPQFVVAVDPQALNARHFHALQDCPNTWLVSEASIDPSVIVPFGSRTFWFRVSNHEPWSWYQEVGIDVGQVDVWRSVLTAAFQVAVLAGCDPIVIVGADLSFTGGRPYCRGTTYEFDWAHMVAEGRTMAQAWRPFLRPDDQIRVPDLHGAETATTGAMQSFRDWMLARAKRSGRRVVNATGAGIFFGDGIEQKSLHDVLRDPCAVLSPAAIARRAPSSTPAAEIARRLWDVHRNACRNAQATPPLDRWKAFCGDGFNLEKVGVAVERAARALERPDTGPRAAAGASGSASIIPWSAVAASGRMQRLATQVPEGMIRFRSMLKGDALPAAFAPPDGEPGVDRAGLLIDAFEVLRSICAASSKTDDLALAVPAESFGRVPLGALGTWPIEIGWAVRLFEALLGEAASASLEPAGTEPSFFSRHVTRCDAPAEGSAGADTRTLPPHLAHACAGLALEWLLCVRQLDAASGPALTRLAAWWRSLVTATTSPADSGATGAAVSLVLESSASSHIDLLLPAGDAPLTRVLTGATWIDPTTAGASVSARLACLGAPSHVASVGVRIGGRNRSAGPFLMPRVLTDEGVRRGGHLYSTNEGAVCTAIRGSESFLVREDGSVEPGFHWPRPINGQLPFGDGGTIAWSAGTARWPDGGSGYVMYRRGPHDEPKIEPLPFGPQGGTWWRDRFYWACFPFGVGSWAPGEPAVFALPDLTLFSVHGTDSSLVLGPRARTTAGAPERRLLTDGWTWRPGDSPEPAALGPRGVVSSRAMSADWTAIAHPEADVIQLERADGVVVSMTCYYPFGLAWTGRSLLVSTADGELLLFENLKGVLDEWIPRGTR